MFDTVRKNVNDVQVLGNSSQVLVVVNQLMKDSSGDRSGYSHDYILWLLIAREPSSDIIR